MSGELDIEAMESGWNMVESLCCRKSSVELCIMKIQGSTKEFDSRLGLFLPEAELSPEQWCLRIICERQNFKESSRGRPCFANGVRVFVDPKVASEVPRMLMEKGYFFDEESMIGSGTLLRPYDVVLSPKLVPMIERLIRSRKLKVQNAIPEETVIRATLQKQEDPCHIQVTWPQIMDASCPAVKHWNDAHPGERIEEGDFLMEVNGLKDIDAMQKSIDDFNRERNSDITLAVKHSQAIRITPSSISAAESEMLRETASAREADSESEFSRLAASSGARPSVPSPGINRWSSEAGNHFENPIGRHRDYGPTNKYTIKHALPERREQRSNAQPSVPDRASSGGDTEGNADDNREHEHHEHEHCEIADTPEPHEHREITHTTEPQDNIDGLGDGSVTGSVGDISQLQQVAAEADRLELENKCKKLRGLPPKERWDAFVENCVRPVLDQKLAAESLPEPAVLLGQRFRDEVSASIRTLCFGKDNAMIAVLFDDEEKEEARRVDANKKKKDSAAKRPFASTFKVLWNTAHSKWESKLPSCKLRAADLIKSELSDVLLEVYKQAYCDPEEKENEDDDEEKTVVEGVGSKGHLNKTPVRKDWFFAHQLRLEKLETIQEDRQSSSKYEQKRANHAFQTKVKNKWEKSGASPSTRHTGNATSWASCNRV